MMLDHFIAANRDEIIARCKTAALRANPVAAPAEAGADHGIPLFLDQLIEALRLGSKRSPDIGQSALHHGHDLLVKGFTVSQVVHAYGDVCQSITQLAIEMNAPISAVDFRTLNQCLDDAIASAVTQYARERDHANLEAAAARGTERLGFFVHELRNLVNTAMVSFEVLKTGNVGVTGSTANILHRSLLGLRSLIDRSLAESRLTEGIQSPERIPVAEFIEQIGAVATLEAHAAGVSFGVVPMHGDVAIEADRQVLSAVMANVLQNAFKFTRPRSAVILRAGATAERVVIEVEDECGGLPAADAEDLVRPFEQRSADRTGLGLGLAFSRWGVEANHGRIHARNLPGRGCIFSVEMPRVKAAIVGTV